MVLILHAFLPCSRANGPGTRAVIWTQGCSLGCPGCFNPATHSFSGGESASMDELCARVRALGDSIEGITVSGGEPLQQREALLEFLRRIRRTTGLSAILFTGFEWKEVEAMGAAEPLARCVDVVIAGRYRAGERVARGLRGSANKTIHFLSPRYTVADIEAVPEAEVIVGPTGETLASGIGPLWLT